MTLLYRHTSVVAFSFCQIFFFFCLKCEYPMWGLFTCMELTCLLLENNKYCKTILTSESVKKVWKWLFKFYKKNYLETTKKNDYKEEEMNDVIQFIVAKIWCHFCSAKRKYLTILQIFCLYVKHTVSKFSGRKGVVFYTLILL